MEKAPGIQLSELWDGMHSRKKYDIIKQLVGFEKAFAAAKLPAYGSLYYSDNLPESTLAIALPGMDVKGRDESFSICPTKNRKHFDDGRGTLDLDRGPCKSNLFQKSKLSLFYTNRTGCSLKQYVTANANVNRFPSRG